MRFWLLICTMAICIHFGGDFPWAAYIGLTLVGGIGLLFDFIELMKGE